MPLSRAHVIMTLASAASSTKIISTGATIGTLTQDRQTAMMGTLGAGPPMIPLDVTLDTPSEQKKYHFEVIESPQLTPTLVATAALQRHRRQPRIRRGLHSANGRHDRPEGTHVRAAPGSFLAQPIRAPPRHSTSQPKCWPISRESIRILTSCRKSKKLICT